MTFSVLDRIPNIQKMANEEFDLVVIGGGISGAGVARDAASRGLRVALIEARDFAEGTSSRSSKLIHGGIRYLENFEFGLVFEALSERRRLFEIAPHLVHPLRFVLPVYDDSRVGMFKLGLGMWAYDALSLFEAPELHEHLNREEVAARVPALRSRDLKGAYAYSDAYMDDDRLVLETLRSAVRYGACIANRVEAVGAKMVDGKVTAVVARDLEADAEIVVRGRHFVSTVGPWTDIVAHKFFREWKDIMRPTKGVHLTFSRDRIPLKDAVVMVTEDQKRIVFAIPRHEMVIIGTTDTDYQGDPANVHTERADVDYLLKVAAGYFPGAKLEERDILASYSGVRPLVDDGAQTESKTSREHLIIRDPRNITFLTGGKYTTYRRMAEQTMDVVLSQFDLDDQMRWRLSRTLEPLNPKATADSIARAQRSADSKARDFGVDVDTAHFLVDRHGEEAFEIIARYRPRISKGPIARWAFEAYHAIHQTMCMSLRDFYLRRVPLFLARRDHGLEWAAELCEIFAGELSWSESKKSQELAALQQHLQFELGWQSSALKNS